MASSVAVGREVEGRVAAWLTIQGYEVIDRNWRTRWCEIDIVARLQGRIHFCEVKYRDKLGSGSGLEAITSTKKRRLVRSAEAWLQYHNVSQANFQIDVASVTKQASVLLMTYSQNVVQLG